jgi:arylsulfatase A-like enzyme
MDLTATFAALAAASPAPDRPLDGINLLPFVLGEQPEVTRTFCWRINRPGRQQKAVRHGPWKYVHDAGYLHFLYNLDEDIGERRNLAIHHPEIVRDLQQRFRAWEAEVDANPKEFVVR